MWSLASKRIRPLHATLLLTFFVVLAFAVRFASSSLPGYGSDLGINAGWAHSGARLGLAQSYQEQLYNNILPNHPPLSIIAYTIVGRYYLHYVSDSDDTYLIAYSLWIRMPAILADLATLVVLFLCLLQWKGWKAATIGGFVQALHPAVIVDSAVWGQVDAIFSFFLLLTLYAFSRKWFVLCTVAYTLAVLAKAQSLALAPLILFLWVLYVPRLMKLYGVIASAVAAFIVLIPFILHGTFDRVLATYTEAVGYFSQLSLNAYNLWWLLFPDDPGRSSLTEVLGPFTYRSIGLFLFEAGILWLLARVYVAGRSVKKIPPLPVLSYIAAAWYLVFFTVNTEMHERYLFPAIILGLPAAFVSLRYAIAYALLSLACTLNVVGVLPVSALDRWFFSFESMDRVVALTMVLLVCFYLADTSRFLRVVMKRKQ